MIDPIILRQKVSKWYEALRYLKENQSHLSPQELTAIEDLQDKWRNGSFDDDMVEEATDMVQILIDSTKYHGNNREIIRWSKEFVGIARDMYTRDAETFKQYYEALGGAAKTHSHRTPTSEVTIGGGHRETVPPPPPGPSIEVYEVTFRNTDYDNNVLSEGDTLPSTSQYIKPIVKYRSASRRKCRVGYRVYNSNGEFLGDKESGYTSIFDSEPYEDGKLTFAGWGNKAGTFWTPGKYRVEIYCDEVKIYETSFSVTPAAPQQPVKPTVTLISAEFENMTINGDRISTNLPYNTQFVCPRIRFKTTGTIHSFEVQYMVYNAAGQRMTANPQKTKVTDIKAGVDYLNSYGSTDGKYWKAGTYKVEFTSEYGGSLTSYFTIPPVPHSVPSSVSSTENKKGCSRYWWVLLIAGALWLMPKGCMSCGSNNDDYSDEPDVWEEAVVEEVVETPTPKPRKKAEPVEAAVSETPVEPVEESVESVSADDYVNDFVQETPQVDYN
ncbi:MAG: hypothetical protein K2M76_01430, partial [Muribaculaceae bacterium]|nr:hypothetical protein [Muribaculaceae bacterium]